MKKIFAIFTAMAIFALFFAACAQPAEDTASTPEEKTSLSIRNECFSDLIDVKWSGTVFADTGNTLGISSSVKKNVSAGSGYIYFSRKQNPVIARTKEIVTIEKGQEISFVFMDNTLVVEASNPDNTGSLKDLISKLLTPSKPVLTAKDGAIEAAWQAVEGATSYKVYIAETETAPAEAAKTVTETSTTITGLANEKTYYVWIQAVSARSESELSPVAQKTLTLGVPGVPTLIAGNGTITANWNPVDMATSYRVYIGTTTTPPEESKTVTAASTTFTGLTNSTPYYVWVQAMNAGGASILSEQAQITLTLAAPQGVTLTAGNGSFTVNWNAVVLADSYKVYYSIGTTPPTEADKIVTETNAVITGLTNGATYNVWVRATNTGGDSALSVMAQKQLVFAAPQSITLTPGNGSITIQWAVLAGASFYNVYFGTSPTRPEAATQSNLTGTSTAISGLSNNIPYYVWVQGVNNGGGGTVSEREQITLTLTPPQGLNVVAGDNSFTANWTAVALANSYKVYYSTTATTPETEAQTVIGTSVTITGLTNSMTYYVWVRAVNLGGESVLSQMEQVLLPINFNVSTSDELTNAVTSINGGSFSNYTVVISANITTNFITFPNTGKKIITISGDSSIHSLTNTGDGPLIAISSGIKLKLGNNITLNGNNKPYPVVKILEGGEFFMETGSTVQGAASNGVYSDGTFTINGGTISGNSTTSDASASGGGVYIAGGTFTMSGGAITGNSISTSYTYYYSPDLFSYARGGGVYVSSGIFAMSGGTISDNSITSFSNNTYASYYNSSSNACAHGGGVYIAGGIFTMSGGTISGNSGTARADALFSVDCRSIALGGGVYVNGGNFIKTGGIIDNTNSVTGDSAHSGGIVAYVKNGSKIRNTTAGATVNLNSNTTGSTGGWEN